MLNELKRKYRLWFRPPTFILLTLYVCTGVNEFFSENIHFVHGIPEILANFAIACLISIIFPPLTIFIDYLLKKPSESEV